MILIATLTTAGLLTSAFSVLLWHALRTHTTTVRELVATLEREQQAHRDQTQMLLQRIQAPERAVVQYANEQAGPPPDGYPLSEKESAMAQDEALRMKMAQESLDIIEAMERDENLTALGFMGGGDG